MSSIMTAPEPAAHAAGDDLGDPMLALAPVAWALARLTPDLWEPGALPRETEADREARHMAALDILDELLAEAAEAAVGGGR